MANVERVLMYKGEPDTPARALSDAKLLLARIKASGKELPTFIDAVEEANSKIKIASVLLDEISGDMDAVLASAKPKDERVSALLQAVEDAETEEIGLAKQS